MAVDVHALNLLLFAAGSGELGRIAMIGRQNLGVSKENIRKLLNLSGASDFGPFCEELLKAHFGATVVDSYDYSEFEGATHVVDLNQPLAAGSGYDTVIDCGSLEHIYNIPEALKNVSRLCADGGQILHVLPSNNYCGHGFWQFSPELFYSLYSERNGYLGTQVFLAGPDTASWYEVKPPENGLRVEITSCTKLLVLVRTVRVSPFRHEAVQQSDYIHVWTKAPVVRKPLLSQILLGRAESGRRAYVAGIFNKLSLLSLAHVVFGLITGDSTLSRRNPRLIKHSVRELLRKQTKPMAVRVNA